MLDKSLEFKHVIMRIESDRLRSIPEANLPDGFSFRFFEPSDVKHWGSIEASVLEFDSESDACNYFEKAYMPYLDELQKRCVFILNSERVPIATATAWYADSELGYQASLHWIAVRPEYQGKGLGKAVTNKALNIFQSLEQGESVWLHTQTWSYPAIKMYHSLGFNLVKSEQLANMNSRDGKLKVYQNDFADALTVLKAVMRECDIKQLADSAV